MYKIYTTAIELAEEQTAVIMRLDIQFNYITQFHEAYLKLSNGNEYHITSTGWKKLRKEET